MKNAKPSSESPSTAECVTVFGQLEVLSGKSLLKGAMADDLMQRDTVWEGANHDLRRAPGSANEHYVMLGS